MPPKPILVNHFIKSGGSVPLSLQETVSEQCRLLKIIRQNLSETFAELVVCCVAKPTELIILTESAALASQLRFHSPDILDALNANSLTGIKSLRFRVLQTNKSAPPHRITRRLPSLESIETLRDCSHSFSDAGLRLSLNRLADTLEKQHLYK